MPAYAGGYLAGLIDGEGCFVINLQRRSDRKPWASLMLNIELRLDERPLLEALRSEFGIGTITERHCPSFRRPLVAWHICRQADLVYLIRILDRFPLRAKKSRDYAIWREAVLEYVGGNWSVERMAGYQRALSAGRKFRAPVPTVKPSPQLKLIV